jgi:hypothetical protein
MSVLISSTMRANPIYIVNRHIVSIRDTVYEVPEGTIEIRCINKECRSLREI